MTIYTFGYAPIEITKAFNMGGGLYFIQAKLTGHYQDGSGKIGEQLHANDKTAKGWFPNTELRADDGIREINEACAKAPQESPGNLLIVDLIEYYGINWFEVDTLYGELSPSDWEGLGNHFEKRAKKLGLKDIYKMAAQCFEAGAGASLGHNRAERYINAARLCWRKAGVKETAA